MRLAPTAGHQPIPPIRLGTRNESELPQRIAPADHDCLLRPSGLTGLGSVVLALIVPHHIVAFESYVGVLPTFQSVFSASLEDDVGSGDETAQ